MMAVIYFDHNGTTQILPEVWESMREVHDMPGNPSAAHSFGRRAKAMIEKARACVKRMVGIVENDRSYRVIFTGSGTESNNLALRGLLNQDALISSSIEHVSIARFAQDYPKSMVLPVDCDGVVHPKKLEQLLQAEKATLLSVMLANNEVGTIQPIKELTEIAHAYGMLVHTDASQATGKIHCSIVELGVDMMTISGHKFGAPPGIAALIYRDDKVNLTPIFKGGGQEYGLRSGTQSLHMICGLATACIKAAESLSIMCNLKEIRDYIEATIRSISQEVVFFGQNADRLPNTSSFTMPGISAEVQLAYFDSNSVAVSAGSACSSGKMDGGTVQIAMGYSPAVAKNAIRISLGRGNTLDEAKTFINLWKNLYLQTRVTGTTRVRENYDK